MANAHGGLIFVGITDIDRKIVGVKTETMAHVADRLGFRYCANVDVGVRCIIQNPK
jgi:hypothetical protein